MRGLVGSVVVTGFLLGHVSGALAHGDGHGDDRSDEWDGGPDETAQPVVLDLSRDPARSVWTVQYLAPGGDYERGVGFGFYHYPGKDRWGYFFNLQVGTHQGEPYYEELDISSFGDPVRGRYQDPVVVNFGATRSLGPIGLFAGVGYGGSSGVARKYDPSHILADDGEYFTPDEALDTSGINFTAGGTIDLGKLSFDLGYNTATTSLYFGVGSSF